MLYYFLTHNKILYDRQYGFRPARSTTDAITEFTTDALPCLDKRENCISVYLDLSKAFDTINHNIMLSKLEYYGIRGKTLEWLKSYLANRRQYVDYRGTHSEIKQIEYGAPQGSVMGPLLFIIYSNDIPHSITYSKTILFADDTTVYLTHQNQMENILLLITTSKPSYVDQHKCEGHEYEHARIAAVFMTIFGNAANNHDA